MPEFWATQVFPFPKKCASQGLTVHHFKYTISSLLPVCESHHLCLVSSTQNKRHKKCGTTFILKKTGHIHFFFLLLLKLVKIYREFGMINISIICCTGCNQQKVKQIRGCRSDWQNINQSINKTNSTNLLPQWESTLY